METCNRKQLACRETLARKLPDTYIGIIVVAMVALCCSSSVHANAAIPTDAAILNQSAGDNQSHDSIVNAAEHFIARYHADSEKVEVRLRELDSRLLLTDCHSDLEIDWAIQGHTSANTSIVVSCANPKPWKIVLRAFVEIYRQVPVLKRAVRVDDALGVDDVEMQLRKVSQLRNDTVFDVSDVIEHRFKRRLPPGKPITYGVLVAPRIVDKGEKVLISASNANLNVRMQGTALASGAIGSLIEVRSHSSRRIIQARITAAGTVSVIP